MTITDFNMVPSKRNWQNSREGMGEKRTLRTKRSSGDSAHLTDGINVLQHSLVYTGKVASSFLEQLRLQGHLCLDLDLDSIESYL